MQSLLSPHGVYTPQDVDGALARVFGAGVRPLRIEQALFDAMLGGWRSQQTARYLKPKTIHANETGCARSSSRWGAGRGSGAHRMRMSTSRTCWRVRSGWRGAQAAGVRRLRAAARALGQGQARRRPAAVHGADGVRL